MQLAAVAGSTVDQSAGGAAFVRTIQLPAMVTVQGWSLGSLL
jgi:hypothetical protein